MGYREWEEVQASVFCLKVADGTHDSPKPQISGKPLITSKHIKGRSIDFKSAYLISVEDFNKINKRSRVDQWDILISMIGEYCGYCYVERNIDVDYAVKNVGIFKTGSKLKAEWIYYYLNSPEGKATLLSLKSGTSQPYISLGALRQLKLLIPNEEKVMSGITSILSSLDDKIELNRQTNQTLEAIAQTLFKEMCVPKSEILPEGWKIKKLKEMISIKHGYAFKSEFFSNAVTPDILLSPGNFKIGGGFNYSKFKYYNGDLPKDYLLLENDLIVTMTDLSKEGDTLGYPALVPYILGKKLWHNQRIGKVEFYNNNKLKYFLYFLMKENQYRNFVLGSATGTTVRHTAPNRICDFQTIVPNELLIEKFNEVIKPVLEAMASNEQEKQTLTSIRDCVLPKLMKGEIEINN